MYLTEEQVDEIIIDYLLENFEFEYEEDLWEAYESLSEDQIDYILDENVLSDIWAAFGSGLNKFKTRRAQRKDAKKIEKAIKDKETTPRISSQRASRPVFVTPSTPKEPTFDPRLTRSALRKRGERKAAREYGGQDTRSIRDLSQQEKRQRLLAARKRSQIRAIGRDAASGLANAKDLTIADIKGLKGPEDTKAYRRGVPFSPMDFTQPRQNAARRNEARKRDIRSKKAAKRQEILSRRFSDKPKGGKLPSAPEPRLRPASTSKDITSALQKRNKLPKTQVDPTTGRRFRKRSSALPSASEVVKQVQQSVRTPETRRAKAKGSSIRNRKTDGLSMRRGTTEIASTQPKATTERIRGKSRTESRGFTGNREGRRMTPGKARSSRRPNTTPRPANYPEPIVNRASVTDFSKKNPSKRLTGPVKQSSRIKDLRKAVERDQNWGWTSNR